jgi:tetratricopeptide (TPR) repeat protein
MDIVSPPVEGERPLLQTPTAEDPTSRLSRLRKSLRNAEFNLDLLTEVENLRKSLDQLKISDDDLVYYKALGTCAEVFDYYGRFEEARELLAEEGARVYAELPSWSRPCTEHAQEILKAKTWLVVSFGQTYYRVHSYDLAREIIERCRTAVQAVVRSESNPCYYTLGHIEYCRGQIYRQLSDFPRASAAFSACLERVHQRLKWFKAHPPSIPEPDLARRLAEEETRAARKTALALSLGLGWIANTQGRLQQAIPLLGAARTLLYSTGDWVCQAYVELLYGIVQRAMAGRDREKLKNAIEILQRPYNIFATSNWPTHGSGHKPYQARAG